MSFEEALKELEAIVRRLETGGQNLDGAIADYTRGASLRRHAEQRLAEARLKVEKIVADTDGVLKTEAFATE